MTKVVRYTTKRQRTEVDLRDPAIPSLERVIIAGLQALEPALMERMAEAGIPWQVGSSGRAVDWYDLSEAGAGPYLFHVSENEIEEQVWP